LEYNTDSEEQRKLMLSFLNVLGVTWPHEVKLPARGVRKRIAQALDYAQAWEMISSGKERIDLEKYPNWNLEHPEVPIRDAARRFSLEEDPSCPMPMRLHSRQINAEEDPCLMDEEMLEAALKEWPPKVDQFLSMRRM
jgi:hypothetical protein